MVELKVCHSELVDTGYALEEIYQQASSINSEDVKGIIVFSSVEFDLDKVSSDLNKRFPNAAIIGGSSFGEMSSTIGWREDSLLVGFLYGNDFQVNSVGFDNISESMNEKLKNEFYKIDSLEETKLCILVTDAFSIGGESVIQSVREYLPIDVPIIGGMAADQWTFTGTKQIHNDKTYKNGISALLVSGDFTVSVSTETGWEPHSKKVTVTKSSGHVVQEINNMKALDFYAETFGTRDGTFGEYPLAIYQKDQVAYFRAPLKWDDESGEVSFAGAVPEGATVAVSSTSRDRAVKATEKATSESLESSGGTCNWAFLTSCAARRQLLGTQAGKEIEIVKSILGNTPVMGFNSYGEYFDMKEKYPNTPGFLNESFCVVTVGKK